MNLDVRLIQVNERMVKHKLLVAVADWVQNCTGNMQVVLLKSAETVRKIRLHMSQKCTSLFVCTVHLSMPTVFGYCRAEIQLLM